MQFLFNTFNHNSLGQRSLEDVIGIMGHQLRALGHVAVWEKSNERFLTEDSGYNIIVEGFTDDVIGLMARARSEGARFIILATEEPTEKGFNFGTQKEMIFRQKTFPIAAKLCEGIIHLVPGKHVTDWYSQHGPTAQAELGYAPSLMRRQYEEPKFDFGFYGSVTGRRKRFLTRLARQLGTVKVMGDFRTQEERDREMQKAKVLIQVRKFESMGLVSSSRCNTALAIGRPVIGEPHELCEPWGSIARFSTKPIVFDNRLASNHDERMALDRATDEGFAEFVALAGFAKATWKQLWNSQMEKFKKLTPEVCIGEPLRQIGILSTEGGRAAA